MKSSEIIQTSPNALYASQYLLLSTDWTQLSNSGLTSDCVSAFATYRSAVRVIRQDENARSNPTSKYTWPSYPEEEWQ